MPFDVEKLSPASWRGVPFLVREITTEGGQKTVVHDYPGNDRRVVENLGEYPDAYTIEAIITGDDYFNVRKNLREAIRKPGLDEFVHPWDGSVTCAVDGQYTFTETDNELGVTTFSFRLVVASEEILPIATLSSIEQASAGSIFCLATLAEGVAGLFGVSLPFPSNFIRELDRLETVGDFFDEKRKIFKQGSDQISEVTRKIDNFKSDVVELINAPAKLGTDIVDLYQSVKDLYVAPIDRFNAMKQFFSFSDYDEFEPTTEALKERKTNETMINVAMQGGALAEAYASAVLVEYENVEELDAAQAELEVQYKIVAEQLPVYEPALTAFADLRDIVRTFFDEQRPQTAQVVSVSTNEIPVAVLAFQYYGNTENTEKLIRLNKFTDVGFIEGDVKVLSE